MLGEHAAYSGSQRIDLLLLKPNRSGDLVVSDQAEAKPALAGLADRFSLQGVERAEVALGFCHRKSLYR